MKIALIYPPFFAKAFNENLPTVDDEFGLFPHIGFGWVARAVKDAGHEARLFDAPASRLSYEQCLQEVRAWGPDLLGFAAHAVQTFRDMLDWAQRFKTDTGLPIVVGGYEAKVYAAEILSHGCFDYLCAGEVFGFMGPFLEALRTGRGLESVPDLWWHDGHGWRENKPNPAPLSFSRFPAPDRSIFPNHLYYSHVSQRRNFTVAMSEVGCVYACNFCCMRSTGFDARPAQAVVDEMLQCRRDHDIREIDFFDPLMFHDRQRVLDICNGLSAARADLIWSCRSRVDSLSFHRGSFRVDEELLDALAASGCRRIYFGVESGSDQVLKSMLKSQSVQNLSRVLDAVADRGIRSLGFMMIGGPGETHQTARETIELACRLPLDYIQFSLTISKPHTELERQLVADLGYDYWREYVRGTVPERILPTPWTTLSRSEQEALAREGYLRFYTRPAYMARMVARIESREEALRYARVAGQLILRPLRGDTGHRLSRSSRVFVEAALANVAGGARHEVHRFGGGFRGAAAMARAEWRGRLRTETPPPRVEATLASGRPLAPAQIDALPGVYAPRSVAAIGSGKRRGGRPASGDVHESGG